MTCVASNKLGKFGPTKIIYKTIDVGANASSFLGLARWLLKPPKPLVMHTQEPNVNVVPLSDTALVNLKNSIEFSSGYSMNTPT
jgi:hypothetical protein